jgi:hypothetical protein
VKAGSLQRRRSEASHDARSGCLTHRCPPIGPAVRERVHMARASRPGPRQPVIVARPPSVTRGWRCDRTADSRVAPARSTGFFSDHTIEPEWAQDVLDYWFRCLDHDLWFAKSEELDQHPRPIPYVVHEHCGIERVGGDDAARTARGRDRARPVLAQHVSRLATGIRGRSDCPTTGATGCATAPRPPNDAFCTCRFSPQRYARA